MRICMLASSYPKYPGDVTAPFVESIASNVASLGHEVHVLAPYHPELRHSRCEHGVYLHFFKYAPWRSLNKWGYAESLEADVKVKGSVFAMAPAALVGAARELWRLSGQHRFDVIQAHWVIPNGPVAAAVARRRGIPLVVSLHGSDVFLAERLMPAGIAATASFRRAARTTSCSTELLSRAVQLGAAPERSRVIPYGVEPGEFGGTNSSDGIREELGLLPEQLLVLAVGRLVYKKGFEYLVQAIPDVLKTVPNVRFVIAGGGDLEAELRDLAARHGVADHLILAGPVRRDKIISLFSAADLFVLPSVRDKRGNVDGLPNVLLEAMASGKPLVASRIAGIPDVVRDGENGYLVQERDSQALAATISRLLLSPALRAQMGQANRHRVETELNWESTARQYLQVFEEAVAQDSHK
ncbi:MAG: glycosyltransferase family 4 protein [Chloroflexi bacterium]|nr:glycosyltransferase family 4 protein [Chloroflexota bacterium]